MEPSCKLIALVVRMKFEKILFTDVNRRLVGLAIEQFHFCWMLAQLLLAYKLPTYFDWNSQEWLLLKLKISKECLLDCTCAGNLILVIEIGFENVLIIGSLSLNFWNCRLKAQGLIRHSGELAECEELKWKQSLLFLLVCRLLLV